MCKRGTNALTDGVTQRFKEAIVELKQRNLVMKGVISQPKGKGLITSKEYDLEYLKRKEKEKQLKKAEQKASVQGAAETNLKVKQSDTAKPAVKPEVKKADAVKSAVKSEVAAAKANGKTENAATKSAAKPEVKKADADKSAVKKSAPKKSEVKTSDTKKSEQPKKSAPINSRQTAKPAATETNKNRK